jgi:hypothetical protein
MAGSLSYVATVSDTTDASSYTFTGAAIGTAAADRIVLAVVYFRTTADAAISGVTIGGNAATQVVGLANLTAGAGGYVGIWALAVASGTTADIVVTTSANALRCIVDVYKATGINATATATSTDNAGPYTASPTVAAGGVSLGAVDAGFATAAAWSGLTERTDAVYESLMLASSASGEFAEAQSPLSISCTLTGTENGPAAVFATFGPSATAKLVIAKNTFLLFSA